MNPEEKRVYKLLKAGIKTWDDLNEREFKMMYYLQLKCPWMFKKEE